MEIKTTLTHKQIGRQIMELRKLRKLSQEELAKALKISRSSLAQIELGNRTIDALELQRLSKILSFSLDEFMSVDFLTHEEAIGAIDMKPKKIEERISVPTLQTEKFMTVLLYILNKCAGKPNVGETVLNKLLYFSDFNYYELYEEHLTGAKYRKLPYGPVPQSLNSIINKMVEDSKIQLLKTEYHGKQQTRYIPLVEADLTKLKASEKDIIDKVIDHMSDWSATTISQYSHKDMPWLASKDGDEINYELVFYRELPFSVRTYGDELEEQ